MKGMIEFYNEQIILHGAACKAAGKDGVKLAQKLIEFDEKKIKWTSGLFDDLCKLRKGDFNASHLATALYRPFNKSKIYYDRQFNHRYKQRMYPSAGHKNIVIAVTSPGNRLGASALMTDALPDLHMVDGSGASQCFPLYLYEKDEPRPGELLREETEGEVIDGYRRRHAITDGILAEFRQAYGNEVSKDDIFYYVYGILHSPEYRSRFSSDLKKMLPRIPLTKETADYKKFTKDGRDLAQWHLNYETIEPYPLAELSTELGLDPWKQFHVNKMTFGKNNKQVDKTRIIYNAHLTLAGIPAEAYDYIVNGKPALEWIMERYQITIDKASGIKNDPNDWRREHDNPRYIVDLIKRVTRVSLETMKIVNSLPALNERGDG
jgi:predicted helicase